MLQGLARRARSPALLVAVWPSLAPKELSGAGGNGARCRTRTYDPVNKSPSAECVNASLQASGAESSSPVHGVYTNAPDTGGIDLSAALASAGLPPDALALAVEALLRTARASAASTPATPPRLAGSA